MDGIKAHYVSTYLVPVNPYNRKNLRKKLDRHGINFRNEFNRTPLMLACETGDSALIQELLQLSADPKLMDNNGFTAFHHLIRYIGERGWNQDFSGFIGRLSPQSTTVRLKGKEIKIGSNKAENLIVNLFRERIYSCIGFQNQKFTAIGTSDLCPILSCLPNSLVPEYRKARTYCSYILSKNEVNSSNPYGLQLFYRLRNGHYILNPELEFSYNGKWLFWDELALIRFTGFPLIDLPYTALVLFLQDMRSHLKNASIARSFMLCYILRNGFYERIPTFAGIPKVGWDELMDYAGRIAEFDPGLPPLPANEEILKKTCNRDSLFEHPFIYPGIPPEEIPLRNYLRTNEMHNVTPDEFQSMLRRQKTLIREQEQHHSHLPEESCGGNVPAARDQQENDQDDPVHDVIAAAIAARKRLEKEAREFRLAQQEQARVKLRELREAMRRKKKEEKQERLLQKKRIQDMTPDLFDFGSGSDDEKHD